MRILLAFLVVVFSQNLLAKPLNVLVWDQYFDPADKIWPQEPGMGQWGEVFAWDPTYASPYSGKNKRLLHGLEVSYILMKDMPEAVVHRVHDAFLPWQDPEVCMLADFPEFNAELKQYGYAELKNCRKEAEARVAELSKFLRKKGIKLVNMSHGTFYDSYVHKNPILLHKSYPALAMATINKYLYYNFLAIGELIEPLFRDNPGTLFVVAAGNNSNDVDRFKPMQWPQTNPLTTYPVPTQYGSYASKYSNVIAVAASYDGQNLAGSSNYGVKSVDFVKHVGNFLVPGDKGMEPFTGTSSAAAETTRLFAQALLQYGDKLALTPQTLKQISRKIATPLPGFAKKVISGGLLEDQVLFKELENRLLQTEALPVIDQQGDFTEYEFPEGMNLGNNSCHSLEVSQDGVVWMAMSFANIVVAFDSKTGQFTKFDLPRTASQNHMDAITVDQNGNAYMGLYLGSYLGRIDSTTGIYSEFRRPSPHWGYNILAVDPKGRVWASSHQNKTINLFDPATGTFPKFWKLHYEHPTAVTAAKDGTVWATGYGGSTTVMKTGGLVHIDAERDEPSYHPIPLTAEGKTLQAFWSDMSDDKIVVTAFLAGFLTFDTKSEVYRHYVRATGPQNYYSVRSNGQGLFAMANASKGLKSIDVYDINNPGQLRSYALPVQSSGGAREALAFDKSGDVWYCDLFSNRFGRLKLAP